MRALASSVTIGTDAWEEIADYDEVTVENAGETTSHASTDNTKFNILRIPVHQMQAKPGATLKVLEDAAFDLETYLGMKVGEKFGRAEATDFVDGTGVNESKGFLRYTSGDGYDKVEQVASTVSGSFAADDFISVQNTLFESFQKNATWMMRRATATTARKLKDGMGRYLLSMEGNLKDGYQNMILGRPVSFAADMPALSGSNLAVAYGDFKQGYLIVDRLGISVLRDPYSSDNHVIWKFRKRVGGGVRQFQAIKIMSILA
jgi:HK97 family phage major capsid protein